MSNQSPVMPIIEPVVKPSLLESSVHYPITVLVRPHNYNGRPTLEIPLRDRTGGVD